MSKYFRLLEEGDFTHYGDLMTTKQGGLTKVPYVGNLIEAGHCVLLRPVDLPVSEVNEGLKKIIEDMLSYHEGNGRKGIVFRLRLREVLSKSPDTKPEPRKYGQDKTGEMPAPFNWDNVLPRTDPEPKQEPRWISIKQRSPTREDGCPSGQIKIRCKASEKVFWEGYCDWNFSPEHQEIVAFLPLNSLPAYAPEKPSVPTLEEWINKEIESAVEGVKRSRNAVSWGILKYKEYLSTFGNGE